MVQALWCQLVPAIRMQLFVGPAVSFRRASVYMMNVNSKILCSRVNGDQASVA